MQIEEFIFPLKWLGVLTATLCGFVIGLERQISGKPVGIRTCCLICVGTYVFASVGMNIPSAEGEGARIVGQIITGIGFIGAGVIMTRGEVVTGITSAAVIWVLAAIGVLVSVDRYSTSIILSLIVIFILRGVTQLEKFFAFLGRGVYSKIHKSKE